MKQMNRLKLKWPATLTITFCLTVPGHAAVGEPPESTPELTSDEVKRLIAGFEAQPSSPAAQRVGKYLLNGKPLWLIASPCCDQFNYLYDAEGHPVCAPSGGISGQGDGLCPEGLKPVAPSRAYKSK